jgi:hypothetical protein
MLGIATIVASRSTKELTRFRLSSINLTMKKLLIKCFGLELARLIVDSCYRDLVIERYVAERRRIQEGKHRLCRISRYWRAAEVVTGISGRTERLNLSTALCAFLS